MTQTISSRENASTDSDAPGPVHVDVVDADGATTGTVAVPGEILNVQANIPLMHQVVVAQLAAARQGTHKAKSRGEVAGGGKKPYRQKGTGRARQGSIRAPQFTGGGVVHGPVPRDHSKRVPKKMKAAALRGALSDRARDGRIHVVSNFVEGEKPSTKKALAALAGMVEARKALVVLDREDELNWKSLRNVPTVHLLVADQLNTYDVLVNDDVVFTTAALKAYLGGELDLTELDKPRPKPKAKSAAKSEASSKESAKSAAPAKKAAAKKTTAKKAAAETTEATGTEAAPEAELTTGPYDGSVVAPADGSVPKGYPIKGVEDEGLYYSPRSKSYKTTVANLYFATADDAKKAGFSAPSAKGRSAAAAEEDSK